MRKKSIGITIILLATVFVMVAASSNTKIDNTHAGSLLKKQDITTKQGVIKPQVNFANVPLYFIHNQGQVHQKALFYAKASRYTLWVTKEGLVFDSSKAEDTAKTKTQNRNIMEPEFETEPVKYERDVSRLTFLGANKNPKVEAIDPNELKVNFFIGNDKSKWQGGVPTSATVLYKELYKHIDLKVYGIEKEIEYDWIVKPGGDPAKIRMAYQDVKATRIDKNGDLVITTGFGDLIHKKPVSYQWQDAKPGQEKTKVPVTASFKKLGKNSYGFTLGSYDKSRPLIIDPVVLAYSTYLGGSSIDHGLSIDVYNSKYAVVSGVTWSADYPVHDEYMGDQPNQDIFISSIDTTQSGIPSLIFSTYIGGSENEISNGITIDSQGIIYITGASLSADYPTRYECHAYQGTRDAILTKYDPNQVGSARLLYSTYLGGSQIDYSYSLALGDNDIVYMTGQTTSPDFPTVNAYQGHQAGADTFVARIDTKQAGMAALTYSTCLGGSADDSGSAIALGQDDHVYISGWTRSTNFPTLNAYQGFQGNSDAFVARLDTKLAGAPSLIYSTYLGGDQNDSSNGLALDSNNHVYIVGYTYSADFPILNQYQGRQAESDGYLTKLDTNQTGNSSLLYSTYLGGAGGRESLFDVTVDFNNLAYAVGYTTSPDFPLKNQLQGYIRSEDLIFACIDTNQIGDSSLIFSTCFGGWRSEGANGISLGLSGNAYLTGYTESTDFPIFNQYQSHMGSRDCFITKFQLITLPWVTTNDIVDIKANEAVSGGDVMSDGGSTVTARGVCWGTVTTPTISGDHTVNGDGKGNFNSIISGLMPATTYYVRAYATNNEGTAYGNELTFTTSSVAPSLTTNAITGVTADTAVSGGDISSDGGATVTARGVCWGTVTAPTIPGDHTVDGSGTGTFTSNMTGLLPGVTYYVRAYATNSEGTAYGNELTFTTSTVAPSLTTSAITSVTADTAVSGGDVSSDGGATVTARGVCWGTVAAPNISGDHTVDGSGTGTFTSNITGLFPGITYYVRAYATNSEGTAYGNELTFTTSTVAPSLTTNAITNITANAAQGGGNVTADGGSAVTARGVCWGTVTAPTIAGDHTVDGSGTGTFTSNITGLFPGITYYVRAYATNAAGTAYGNEVSFTTSVINPSITTNAITNISTNAAQGGGNITADGGSAVTARGVCWGTATAPTVAGNHTVDGSGTGAFTSSMTGLVPATTYYVRAYATNAAGTAYGNEVSFNTVAAVPVVKTIGVSNITFSEALARGKVTGDGGAAVNNRGICVSTNKRPDLGNSMVIGAGSGLGEFSCQLDNLVPATTYYVRAFAKNAAGTGYGRILSFKTLELPKPMISGKVTAWGTGVAGVVLQFSNNGGQTLTDQMGNYSHIMPYQWTGTATPVKEGYYFQPVSRSYENITSDQVSQNYEAYNIVLSIQATKKKESAWLVNKLYGEIILNVINPGNIAVDKYIIYRKTGDGSFQALAEIPGNQIQSSYTYIDKFLEQDALYTYKFTALAPDGTILATSPEQTI